MSTYNICFREEIRKISIFLVEKKALSRAMGLENTQTVKYQIDLCYHAVLSGSLQSTDILKHTKTCKRTVNELI